MPAMTRARYDERAPPESVAVRWAAWARAGAAGGTSEGTLLLPAFTLARVVVSDKVRPEK